MSVLSKQRALAGLLLVLLAPAPFLAAQEVKWRRDYAAGRREAQEKGLPLLLDFGTDNCFWCKKLDATTFRDPAICAALNDYFVPLKIDGNKEAALAEALRINGYPTLVVAAPDGKILGSFEGYVEAPRLADILQRAANAVNNPEWMNRDYQDAVRSLSAADYARAVALLKKVTDDGKERPVQLKARQLLQDLEEQVVNRVARAKQLDEKGQTAEAMATLTETLRAFGGTQAAAEASAMLTSLANKPEVKTQTRSRRARDLLAQAREDYRTEQYLWCLDRCEMLARNFADLPEGLEAMQLANEIKNNPEWLSQAAENLGERLSSVHLAMAESWLKKGQPQQAALSLEKVIRAFPGSRQAEAAQIRLAQIQGRPTFPADFKKP